MALSPAEKQRRYRERKVEALAALPDASLVDADKFPAFIEAKEPAFRENLDFVGITIRGSLEDEDHPVDRPEDWQGELNSLTRATSMVGVFLDAAIELATIVNEYKAAQIDAELSRAKGKSIARLRAARARLDRKTSVFLPVYEVKGE